MLLLPERDDEYLENTTNGYLFVTIVCQIVVARRHHTTLLDTKEMTCSTWTLTTHAALSNPRI